MRFALVIAAALLLGLPASGYAQGCELLENPPAREIRRMETSAGEVIFVSGPARFVCDGGITLQADSAMSITATGQRYFIGNVFYADTVKELTADWVNYFGHEGRLEASGSVVLTDVKTRSVVRGTHLRYWRGSGNQESRAEIQGNPSAVLYGSVGPQSAASDSAAPPLEVTADAMEIRGQRHFIGLGRVHLTRGGTNGYGREARYDQTEDRLELIGDARFVGENVELTADRIDAQLAGEKLREIAAQGNAVGLADEIRVEAPALRITMEDGQLQRLIALGGGEGSARQRATTVSHDFRLWADSIDALAPGQHLERVLAAGDAYGERLDSIARDAPELVSRDRLWGDTVVAYFTAADTAAQPNGTAADTAQAERVLERLITIGPNGRARAMYRSQPDEQQNTGAGLDYFIAERIDLHFRDGVVREMEAQGPVRGIHLDEDPARPAPRQAAAAGRRSQ